METGSCIYFGQRRWRADGYETTQLGIANSLYLQGNKGDVANAKYSVTTVSLYGSLYRNDPPCFTLYVGYTTSYSLITM